MNYLRGFLYIVVGIFAFFRSWQFFCLHRLPWAFGSLALGVAAIGLGIYLTWRLSRR